MQVLKRLEAATGAHVKALLRTLQAIGHTHAVDSWPHTRCRQLSWVVGHVRPKPCICSIPAIVVRLGEK